VDQFISLTRLAEVEIFPVQIISSHTSPRYQNISRSDDYFKHISQRPKYFLSILSLPAHVSMLELCLDEIITGRRLAEMEIFAEQKIIRQTSNVPQIEICRRRLLSGARLAKIEIFLEQIIAWHTSHGYRNICSADYYLAHVSQRSKSQGKQLYLEKETFKRIILVLISWEGIVCMV
jgi:hypothetical protein